MLTMQGTEGRRSFPRRDWDGGWSHLEVNLSSFACSCSAELLFNVVETQNLFFRWGVANGEIQNKEVRAWQSKYLTSTDFDSLSKGNPGDGISFSYEDLFFFTWVYQVSSQFCSVLFQDSLWRRWLGFEGWRENIKGRFHWFSLVLINKIQKPDEFFWPIIIIIRSLLSSISTTWNCWDSLHAQWYSILWIFFFAFCLRWT